MSTPTGPQEPQFATPGQAAYGQNGQNGYAAPQGYGAQGQPAYGQYAEGQGGMTGPAMPQGQGYYAPAAVVRPPAMDKAIMLMRAGAVMVVVDALAQFFLKDQIDANMSKWIEQLTGQAGTATQTSTGSALVSALLSIAFGCGLWLWMAHVNGKGKSWGRVVATVFFAISTLGLGSLLAPMPILMHVLSIISWLIGLAAIIFMYKKESSRFYEESSRTY